MDHKHHDNERSSDTTASEDSTVPSATTPTTPSSDARRQLLRDDQLNGTSDVLDGIDDDAPLTDLEISVLPEPASSHSSLEDSRTVNSYHSKTASIKTKSHWKREAGCLKAGCVCLCWSIAIVITGLAAKFIFPGLLTASPRSFDIVQVNTSIAGECDGAGAGCVSGPGWQQATACRPLFIVMLHLEDTSPTTNNATAHCTIHMSAAPSADNGTVHFVSLLPTDNSPHALTLCSSAIDLQDHVNDLLLGVPRDRLSPAWATACGWSALQDVNKDKVVSLVVWIALLVACFVSVALCTAYFFCRCSKSRADRYQV